MMKLVTAFLVLASTTSALAQQASPEITIKFRQEQLSVLAQALEAMPYKVAAPLISDIQRQIQAQQQPAPEKPGAPPEAK